MLTGQSPLYLSRLLTSSKNLKVLDLLVGGFTMSKGLTVKEVLAIPYCIIGVFPKDVMLLQKIDD